MSVNVGDMLAWKHEDRDVLDPALNEYFLVVEIDTGKVEPYILLNMSRGGYETFKGACFKDAQYWELIA